MDQPELIVLSWNLERGARAPVDTVAAVRDADADLVALQELEPEHAAALDADPVVQARFPYRAFYPDDGYLGVGLLSRYPLGDVVAMRDPAAVTATIDTSAAPVWVINAHPLPARLTTATPFGLPVGLEPSRRDGDIRRVRDLVDRRLARREHVLVLGDFNTSPTEAAYRDLVLGLRDAHVEAGQGPGWTWRPNRLEWLPMGILRIDLALGGPGMQPVSSVVDCSLPGDHCRQSSGFEVSREQP